MSFGCATSAASHRPRSSNGAGRQRDSCGGASRQIASSCFSGRRTSTTLSRPRERNAGRVSRRLIRSQPCAHSCATRRKRSGAQTVWRSRFLDLGSISKSPFHMRRIGLTSGECWPMSTPISRGIFVIEQFCCCLRSMACGAAKWLLCGSTRSIGLGEPQAHSAEAAPAPDLSSAARPLLRRWPGTSIRSVRRHPAKKSSSACTRLYGL